MLMLVWLRWKTARTSPAVAVGRGDVVRMALRNAARTPAAAR